MIFKKLAREVFFEIKCCSGTEKSMTSAEPFLYRSSIKPVTCKMTQQTLGQGYYDSSARGVRRVWNSSRAHGTHTPGSKFALIK